MADTDTQAPMAADAPDDYGREGLPTGEHHQPTDAEEKARNKRNIAIALSVVGFVILIYLTTFFRLAENLKGAAS